MSVPEHPRFSAQMERQLEELLVEMDRLLRDVLISAPEQEGLTTQQTEEINHAIRRYDYLLEDIYAL